MSKDNKRVAAVLGLHKIEARYQPYVGYELSFDSPEEAAEYTDMLDISQVTFFEICAECGRIEMEAQDAADERSYREAIWPCKTIQSIASVVSRG